MNYTGVKVVIFGDSSVGKTCLMHRYTENEFLGNSESTIGVDSQERMTRFKNKMYNVRIWDTAGQEKYSRISSSFYRNVDGVVLAFDCTNSSSFEAVESWFSEVNELLSFQIPKVLVCTKIDLCTHREVSRDATKGLAAKLGIPYQETSALNGSGVDRAFELLLDQIELSGIKNNQSFKIQRPNERNRKKPNCCSGSTGASGGMIDHFVRAII